MKKETDRNTYDYSTEKNKILNCIRLGKIMAKKYSERSEAEFSELFSVVNFNIPKILPKIDPNNNPSSFICRSFTGYILNYLRDQKSLIHIPRKIVDSYWKNEQLKRIYSQECTSYNPHESIRSAPEILLEDIGDHDDCVGFHEGSPYFSELYKILQHGEIEILQLFYVERWTYKQIGVSLDLPPSQVKNIILESVSKLQHLRPYIS